MGSSPCSAWPQRRQAPGRRSVDDRSSSGGTRARNALRWPGCPPRLRREGGVGGFRFRPIGSEEGGLEEFVELSPSRARRSRTVVSTRRSHPGAHSRHRGGRLARPRARCSRVAQGSEAADSYTVIRTNCTNCSGCERLHWSSSNPALPMRGLTRERLSALHAGPQVASSACCCPLNPFGRRSADRFTRLLPAGSGVPRQDQTNLCHGARIRPTTPTGGIQPRAMTLGTFGVIVAGT